MFSIFGKKKDIKDVQCKCGHDIMLHGFSNMGCSVFVKDDTGKNKKCPCSKFEKV